MLRSETARPADNGLTVNLTNMAHELDGGPASVARIGLAALAGNQTTEPEFRRILGQDGVEFYTARLPDSRFAHFSATI